MNVWFSKKRLGVLATLVVGVLTALASGQEVVPPAKPDATINLATDEGAKLVKGQWRYSDTKIIEVDFKSPGADKQPTGAPNRTYDYTPKAGPADFDDST